MTYINKEIRDGVAILSFNKPEVHNAFDDEATEEAIEAFEWARRSREFRVVLLRGEGKSFCSGRDARRSPLRTSPTWSVRPRRVTPSKWRPRVLIT